MVEASSSAISLLFSCDSASSSSIVVNTTSNVFMTADELVAVVEQPTVGLNFIPAAPSSITQEQVVPVTLLYPPVVAVTVQNQNQLQPHQQYLSDCQPLSYRRDIGSESYVMSATDFSHPPPTSSGAATYRPSAGASGVIMAAAPVALQNFVPMSTGITNVENFSSCGDSGQAASPYVPVENSQMTAAYTAFAHTTAPTQPPMMAYNHYAVHQPAITFVQNSAPQHFAPNPKSMSVPGNRKHSIPHQQTGMFPLDAAGSSFVMASATSDSASSCSGGTGGGKTCATDSVVYHRQRSGRKGSAVATQMRQYSDPRPSTSGQPALNEHEAVTNITVDTSVADTSSGIAKTNTAKSTGVDSVDSADSGLTADHSSPEHRTSTPTTTHSDGAPRMVQTYPYQSPANVHHTRPQTLPFHSEVSPVMLVGSRYEATMENEQSTSAGNASSTSALNPSGSSAISGGTGGGVGESASSSPAPPPSSGDGGSNGGGPNSTPSAAIGFPPVGPHAVYVHVNLGETLSVRVGNEIQHIPGPATVRMVSSHSAGPPVPLPLHVPPGHIVQQIVDENGTLRHLILSPQTPQPPPATSTGPFPCVSVPSGPMGPSVQFVPVSGNTVPVGTRVHAPASIPGPIHPPNGVGPMPVAVFATAPSDCPPGPSFHPLHNPPHQTAVLQPSSTQLVAMAPLPAQPHNPNMAPSGATRHPLHLHTNPPHICQPHINGGNGEGSHLYAPGERGCVGRTMNRGGGKNVGNNGSNQRTAGASSQRAYQNDYQDPENSSSLHDTTMDDNISAATSGGNEDEEISKIAEMLSRIPAPQVCDIGPREALVQWQPFDCSEASASGGPFPQIDASEFTYEILLYERRLEGKPASNYRCQADQLQQQWLYNLKPSTEYFVRLRALLEERGLRGEPSSAVAFITKPTHPDKMQPPRLQQRAKTWLMLRWQPPCDNGAKITGYHLEVDEGGAGGDANFKEIYFGTIRQFKLQKLQPSTLYRVRMAASNVHGKGEYSDILLVQTTGAPPPPPEPPVLVQASSYSLSLRWKRRDCDDEFQLLMEDPQTGHGYLPVATTRDVSFVVQSLLRYKEYRFRLTACNDDGRSLPSDCVTFRTLPSRPQAPSRPHAKGRVASNNVKIAWESPRDPGGSEIIQFHLEMCNEGQASWNAVYDGAAHEYHVIGLEPGTAYRFRVACSTVGGRSAYSDELQVTTSPVAPGPCRPPALHGKVKTTSLHLKWTLPEFHGGAEISEYELMLESPSSPAHTSTVDAGNSGTPSAMHSHTVYQGPRTDFVVSAGLLPGRTYSFRVRAYNRAGAGPWSERLECQTASAPPDCPQRLRAIGQMANSLRLTWDPPMSNNGAPVVEFRLHQACRMVSRETPVSDRDTKQNIASEKTEMLQRTQSADSPSSSPSIVSKASSRTAPVRQGSAASSASAASSMVENVWETEYGPINQISVGLATSYEVKGLRPATDYVFRIQAVNNAGSSRLSDPVFCSTTPGVPETPSGLKAETLSRTEVSLVWEFPSDNGSPIIGYYLDVTPPPPSSSDISDSSNITVPIELPASSTHHMVENLLPETTYRFRIQAYNEVGVGPYSSSAKATTFSPPPPPPSLELAAAAHNSLKLRWNEPATSSAPGSILDNTITYTVEVENKSGGFSPVATELTTRSCKVPRLSESTLYRFRIRACSATGGLGLWSEIFAFRTLKTPPPAVKSAPRVSDVTETSCQIDWQPVKLNALGFSLSSGEKIHYSLQVHGQSLSGSSNGDDFHTVYSGLSTSFHLHGLVQGSNYRIRVCLARVSPPSDPNDSEATVTLGAASPACSFSTLLPVVQRKRPSENLTNDGTEGGVAGENGLTSLMSGNPHRLSDRQWAVLILLVFSVVALLVAFVLQRFIPSTHASAGSGMNGNGEQGR